MKFQVKGSSEVPSWSTMAWYLQLAVSQFGFGLTNRTWTVTNKCCIWVEVCVMLSPRGSFSGNGNCSVWLLICLGTKVVLVFILESKSRKHVYVHLFLSLSIKKIFLTSVDDMYLLQSWVGRLGDLRVLHSILVVPDTAIFWTECSDVVPGFFWNHCQFWSVYLEKQWKRQGNLSSIELSKGGGNTFQREVQIKRLHSPKLLYPECCNLDWFWWWLLDNLLLFLWPFITMFLDSPNYFIPTDNLPPLHLVLLPKAAVNCSSVSS